MAQDPRKGKDHPDAQVLQEQREETQKHNEAAMKRMDTSQPTPTQEENDLAKLGIHVDEKQDDKSGPTVIERSIVANEPLPRGGYETRSARAKRDERRGEEQKPLLPSGRFGERTE